MKPHPTVRPLLDLDPDLGRLLSDERVAQARAELQVHVSVVRRGPWNAARLSDADGTHLGLLVLDGVLAREILLADTISTELMGTGDLLRPWHEADGWALPANDIRWTVLDDLRVAVLDRRFARQLSRFPEVNSLLLERMSVRIERVAISQAISQLNGVDRRLLALFWHLAARWGRVTPDGVGLPMALSHRLLAELVGARRPTVTTALRHLAERGELIHREDATWLLTGQPVGIPTTQVARLVEHRGRLVLSEPSNGREPQTAVHSPADGDELRERRAARSDDPLTQAASG
jgi:CRP/FNR family transcriptional regulator, cyclic AMP receptor protein